MNYYMMALIPILNVPDDVTIQEARVKSEIWLLQKIPDAKMLSFEQEQPEQKGE